jgi:hypothetical protein
VGEAKIDNDAKPDGLTQEGHVRRRQCLERIAAEQQAMARPSTVRQLQSAKVAKVVRASQW